MNEKVQSEIEILDADVEILRQKIFDEYGYDFRGYTKNSQKRRVIEFMRRRKLGGISELLEQLKDPTFIEVLVGGLVISTTEFFRDPACFVALRREVLPILKTYNSFKIWHAGCSTGEEPFSLAILLHEAGLLERAIIYATDIDKSKLVRAKEGVVSSASVKHGAKNYFDAGCRESLSSYFTSDGKYSRIASYLVERITFGEHNLVTDASFGEMNLILCRNVLIYFDQDLQEHVIKLFLGSLIHRGFLCLGEKESLYSFQSVRPKFEVVDSNEKIFQLRAT